MKTEIKKRTLRNEKVANLMWGYSMLQTVTFLFANYFSESMLLKVIFLIEEILLIISLVREVKEINKFNELIACGSIQYGEMLPG